MPPRKARHSRATPPHRLRARCPASGRYAWYGFRDCEQRRRPQNRGPGAAPALESGWPHRGSGAPPATACSGFADPAAESASAAVFAHARQPLPRASTPARSASRTRAGGTSSAAPAPGTAHSAVRRSGSSPAPPSRGTRQRGCGARPPRARCRCRGCRASGRSGKLWRPGPRSGLLFRRRCRGRLPGAATSVGTPSARSEYWTLAPRLLWTERTPACAEEVCTEVTTSGPAVTSMRHLPFSRLSVANETLQQRTNTESAGILDGIESPTLAALVGRWAVSATSATVPGGHGSHQ
mmetsp:Transcript_97182/g.274897  ORF Transcript_97182/g.274897 Transcript_97182/m.274897 type:complete len:295 (-) Transcript_97182:126-1010(-)